MPQPRRKAHTDSPFTWIRKAVSRLVDSDSEKHDITDEDMRNVDAAIRRKAVGRTQDNGYVNPELLEQVVSESAVSLLEDLFNANVRVPVMKAVGITPKPIVHDENYYTEQFKDSVRKYTEESLDKKQPGWRDRVRNGETVHGTVSGNDYVPPGQYGGTVANKKSILRRALVDQVENTLGGWTVDAGPDGMRIRDVYDFNRGVHPVHSKFTDNVWGWLRENVANGFGTDAKAPDNEKIQTDMLLPYTWACGGRMKRRNNKYLTI